MERRLINLEMRGFEAELNRRNQTLDILMADRMRYWLAGWKQSYAAAFETDSFSGPVLRPHQCLERIRDLEAFIKDRRFHEDRGRAAKLAPWLRAMKATYRLAGGEGLPDETEVSDEETPAQAEAPPSPEAMVKKPFMARASQIAKLTGRRPKDGDEARDIYVPWYAKWYQEAYGSEYRPAA